jgi:hypothetical protein
MNEATLIIGVRSLDKFFEGVAKSVNTQGQAEPSRYFPITFGVGRSLSPHSSVRL